MSPKELVLHEHLKRTSYKTDLFILDHHNIHGNLYLMLQLEFLLTNLVVVF